MRVLYCSRIAKMKKVNIIARTTVNKMKLLFSDVYDYKILT